MPDRMGIVVQHQRPAPRNLRTSTTAPLRDRWSSKTGEPESVPAGLGVSAARFLPSRSCTSREQIAEPRAWYRQKRRVSGHIMHLEKTRREAAPASGCDADPGIAGQETESQMEWASRTLHADF